MNLVRSRPLTAREIAELRALIDEQAKKAKKR